MSKKKRIRKHLYVAAGAIILSVGMLGTVSAQQDSAGTQGAVSIAQSDIASAISADRYDSYYDHFASVAVKLALEKLSASGVAGAKLDEAKAGLEGAARQYKPIFINKIASFYRQQFTADELDILRKFYSSPLGIAAGQSQKSIQDAVSLVARDAGTVIGVAAGEFGSGKPSNMAAAPTLAKDPPADALIATLHYDRYYSNISDLAVTIIMSNMKDSGISDRKLGEARIVLEAAANQYKLVFLERVSALYRQKFPSDGELNNLNKFYSGAAGAKALLLQNALQNSVAEATRNAGIVLGAAAAHAAHL